MSNNHAGQSSLLIPMPKVATLSMSGQKQFKLVEDYYFYSPSFNKVLFVPKNFTFDGASIPWPFTLLIKSTDALFIASLFHDFGYTYGGLLVCIGGKIVFQHKSKWELDEVLSKVNYTVSGTRTQGCVTRLGVTLGGWLAWWKCRRENRNVWEDFKLSTEEFVRICLQK